LARLHRPATSTTTKKEKKSAEGKLLEVKTLLWVELKERRLQLALVPLASSRIDDDDGPGVRGAEQPRGGLVLN
jgi:hypothetical protein